MQGLVRTDMQNHHALLDNVTEPPQTDTPGTGTAQSAESSFLHVEECYTNVDTNQCHLCVQNKSLLVFFMSMNYRQPSDMCT